MFKNSLLLLKKEQLLVFPIFKIMLSILFLTLSTYAIADVELYSSGAVVIPSTPTVRIDSNSITTNFDSNTGDEINSGIKGDGIIIISTDITSSYNKCGVYTEGTDNRLDITGNSTFKMEGNIENAIYVNGSKLTIDVKDLIIDGKNAGKGIIAKSGQIEIKQGNLTVTNTNGTAIDVDGTSSLKIENVENIEISNNENGIIGKAGDDIEISGSNLILKDNTNIALENVTINNNTVTIQESVRTRNFDNTIGSNIAGTGNTITIDGFIDGINLSIGKAENLFFNNKIIATNNNIGFIINDKELFINKDIDANNNDTGLKINKSSVTFSNLTETIISITDSKNGMQILDSTVTFNTTNLKITSSTENGLTIENSNVLVDGEAAGSMVIKESQQYAIYVDTNSYLEIRDVGKNYAGNAIKIEKNKNGIYGEEKNGRKTVEIINSIVELIDNEELALRNVRLVSNTITVVQTLEGSGTSYRTVDFDSKIYGISGYGNNLTVSGFQNGINLSSDIFNNEGWFSGNDLTANDNDGYGFQIKDTEYNLVNEAKKITANNNNIGFKIENSSTTIMIKEVALNYNERGLQITGSTVTAYNTIGVTGSKGYGIETKDSFINLFGRIEVDGKQKDERENNGKGINIVNSVIIANGASVVINNSTGTALKITESEYSGEQSGIYVSSATTGLEIVGASNVDLFARVIIDDDEEKIYGGKISISDAERAITVEDGSSLRFTSGTITMERAKEGIIGGTINFVGQEQNNVEITNSELDFNNIEGIILKNVNLVNNKMELVGLGKDKSEDNNLGEKFINVTGEGNTLSIKEFNEGLILTEGMQTLFNGGQITAENNNVAIKAENVNTGITNGTITAGNKNNVAFEITGSTVTIGEADITFENNVTGFSITDSKVDFDDTNLTLKENEIGMQITSSTVNMNIENSEIGISSSIYAIQTKSSSMTIKTSKGINLSYNGTGIENDGSYVGIDLNSSAMYINNGMTGIKVINGGTVEIKNSSSAIVTNNRETGIKVGNGSQLNLTNDIGVSYNSNGILIEDGGILNGKNSEISIIGNKTGNGIGLEIKGVNSKIFFDTLAINSNKIGLKVSSGAQIDISESSKISLVGNTETTLEVEGNGSNVNIYGEVSIGSSTITDKSKTLFKATDGGQILFHADKYKIYRGVEEVAVYAKGSKDGSSSQIIFDNDVEVTIGKKGMLAEDGGQITAKNITVTNNTEAGIEISGKDSNITFDTLAAKVNGYGIKVSSGAVYNLNSDSVNMTLEGNTVTAIGVIGATMTIKSAGNVNLSGSQNKVGMILDNEGYLKVEQNKDGIFALNYNLTNGIEIKGNSQANFDGKLQTNHNGDGDGNGIFLERGSLLDATEIETSSNKNGILIQDNENAQIYFSTLTANNNDNGIKVVKSSWVMTGNTMNFKGNKNAAINVEGSYLAISEIKEINSENNDIFLKVINSDKIKGEVNIETDNLRIGNNNTTGLYVKGTARGRSEVFAKKITSNDNKADGIQNKADGIQIDTYGTLNAQEIEVNNNTNAGLKIMGNESIISVSTLTAKNNKYGIEMSKVRGNVTIDIANMEVEENTDAGMFITESEVTLTEGIKINNNAVGLKITDDSSVTSKAMIEVTNNKTSDNNGVGLELKRSSLKTNGLNMSGNNYGINIVEGDNVNIEFNGDESKLNIEDNTKAGIRVEENGRLEIKGTISSMTSCGTGNLVEVVSGGELVISASGFKAENSKNGIYLFGESNLVTGNNVIEVNNNRDNGILTENDVRVEINEIKAKNNGTGIRANVDSDITVIKSLTIEGGEHGIYAASGGTININKEGTITGTKIGMETDENGNGIIDLKSSIVTITESTVAIRVSGVNNIKASNATLNLNNNERAIDIIGGGSIDILNADIERNTVGINVTTGTTGSISGKTISLTGNTVGVKANTNSNFTISDEIGKLSLTDNTIGLLATENGKITIEQKFNMSGNETLIKAEKGGVVEIDEDLTIKGNTVGISVSDNGNVIGDKKIILQNNTTAIEAGKGGTISFTGIINITSNTTGLNLAGGALNANEIKITSNTTGVKVTSGTNTLANVEINDNGTGINLSGGNLTLTDASIKGNSVAIDIANESKLTAAALTLTDNEKGILVSNNTGTIEIGKLELGTEQIEVADGTLNAVNTTINKTNGAVFNTNGASSKINITGSKIKAESLIETEDTISVIESKNSTIESKIEDTKDLITLIMRNNSNWQLSDASTLNRLQLDNSTVQIGKNVLTVNNLTGVLSANASTIEMVVDISKEEDDKLIITEGGHISGKYVLKVTSAKEVNKEEAKEQIRIIKAGEYVEHNKDTFKLDKGRINISGYVYKLYQGSQLNIANIPSYNNAGGLNFVTGSGIDKYSWYLVNSKDVSEYIKGIVRASELMTFIAKSGMNTMNKRVGDIRRTPEDSYNGVWVRTFGKNYDVSEGIKSNMSLFGFEGGYDMRISRKSQDRYYIGAMIGYQSASNIKIKQEDEERDSTGEGSAPSLGIYGSWLGQDGWYADIAARYIMVETKMKGYNNGEEIEYKPKANYVGFSAEVGKEIDINVSNGALIRLEPKIEISMAQRATSKADVSDGSEIEFGGGNSINGKLGISAGYQIELEDDKELTPFIELAYNNEFEGKTDVNYIGEQYNSDLSGGGIEASIGLNGYLGKGFNVYSLVSYESGSKQSNLGWNIGVRYGFGGKKELTRNNIKKKEREIDEIDEAIDTVKDTRNIERVVVIRNQALEKTADGQINKIAIADDNRYVKQSEITSGQTKYIRELADGLSTDRIRKIIIASHVGDNTGDESLNKRVSVEKAKRVKQIMVKAGIEEEKIEIRGYGSKKQIADNGSREGRNKNNRVEIFIKR